ncbi:hypothetical protein [uncultured Roseibium sp.]|uniref:hypothetical protein n=1 Tax=uncultured Roseibium sp. TaxID=1936171 RepID=UPI00260879C5|nr:hypothetical protein [uncultured Roseibium sp.]
MSISRWVLRLALSLCLILGALPITMHKSFAETLPNQTRMGTGEFTRKFQDNRNVQLEDLNFFPERLKEHLKIRQSWETRDFNVFSRKIEHKTYLFVVLDRGGAHWTSTAALVRWRASTGTPEQRVDWKPLVLPSLQRRSDGWSFIAGEFHFILQWNDRLNALQNTFCGGMRPTSCIRYSSSISWTQQELTLIELRQRVANEWYPVWKSGGWLFDPSLQDLGPN